MKGYWIAVLLLVLAAPVRAEQEVLQPNDFGWGIKIDTWSKEPFFRVTLPKEAYVTTAWPDMRDVRVFNNQGNPVPFALLPQERVQETEQRFPLQIFPLHSSKVVETEDKQQQKIWLRSESGVEILVLQPVDGKTMVSYLLKLAEENADSSAVLSQLLLRWPQSSESWQTRATVMISKDLQYWSPLVEQVPLMDLTSGDNRLLLNQISLSGHHSGRYWLLMFDSDPGQNVPVIEGVEGVEIERETEQKKVNINFTGEMLSPTEAVYQLERPILLSTLSIWPAEENQVLPLQVEYRSEQQGEWRPLMETVAYRLQHQGYISSNVHNLDQLLIQGVRLRTVNTQWGSSLPEVTGMREEVALVFNAQGSGPYLLSWGARAASAAAIPFSALLPPSMQGEMQWQYLPSAAVEGEVISLGGSERLKALSPGERASLWQKGLLWALLVVGAGGLALLAWKLWQEMMRKAP